MICLNCGRPIPSGGSSLCDRCRERRPGVERARGGVIYQRTRETARVSRRGPGILVAGVLFLAALIFAGGTLAVFMQPKGPPATDNGLAFVPGASATRLEIFEQITPTPEITPSATAWFPSFTPTIDPFATSSLIVTPALPTDTPTPTQRGQVTPRPTRPPTATPTKTPRPPTATPTDRPTPTPTPRPTKPPLCDEHGQPPGCRTPKPTPTPTPTPTDTPTPTPTPPVESTEPAPPAT